MTPPSKYIGEGSYSDLTEGEQAHYDEYTNLRGISDWPGFDDRQDMRRGQSREWLVARMAEIEELAATDGGWDKSSRGLRWDYLSTLNSGDPKHEVRLPCSGTATDAEKSYIEEREVYLTFASTTDEQKARKQANVDWLVAQRQKLYRLMKDDPGGNKANDRQTRYDNLCIATHHGEAYRLWDKAHNKWGEPYAPPKVDKRQEIMRWCETYLGVSERPSGSNKGHPQPSGWQKRVYGDDGVPWCACFAVCSAWDNGITGTGTAGCAANIALARKGQGIYKAYTTDPTKAKRGDHFFIGGKHTGVVRSDNCTSSNIPTYEGNTSPGSEGSQYNGGTTAKRTRSMAGGVTGFGLVRV